jgi:hypothetical protein
MDDRIQVNPYEKNFDQDKLHVITMVSNPLRFTRRYELFHRFRQYMLEQGVCIWAAEIQDGNRPFCCTDKSNPRDLQLRTETRLWHKENALNLLIQRLPSDWKYVAWIDADITFMNPNWIQETIHELQIHQIVQMWENAIDQGPMGETFGLSHSFMGKYVKGGYRFPEKWERDPNKFGHYQGVEFHPGYAWAATRTAINNMGLLMDRAIAGAGDRHMALAWTGKAEHSFHPNAPADYKKYVMDYQERCAAHIRKNVGYVDGTIVHYFHGSKKKRGYWTRWSIINDNNYSPFMDLRTDWQGLLQLDDYCKVELRNALMSYFSSRSEDETTME